MMGATVSMSRIHWLEFRAEFLKMLRMPAYAIPTLAFPLIFYALFRKGRYVRDLAGTFGRRYADRPYLSGLDCRKRRRNAVKAMGV